MVRPSANVVQLLSPSVLPSHATLTSVNMRVASKLFLVMGFGYIFPYCAMMQPVDYWTTLFPNFNLVFALSCVYNVANILTFVVILWRSRTPQYSLQIVGGFAVQVVVLILVPLSYYFLSGESQHLVMVLTSTGVLAIASSFLDSAVFSLASLFPKGALENVQLGIGFSNLITATYRLVTKAMFPSHLVVESSMMYFGVGALTVVGGVVAYLMLKRLAIARETLKTAPQQQQSFQRSLWTKILLNEVLLALSYLCSLLLWPGVVSNIPSYNFPSLNANGWWPLLLMALFALSDVVGRFAASKCRLGITRFTVWKVVLPRFALVPLMVCAATGHSFTHDGVSVLFVTLLGLSGGFACTLAVVVVSDCVDDSEKGATGVASAFFINLGIVLGATLSVGLANCMGLAPL
ncbi:hypothetical protein H257_02707 [Aphanomyces astaci]|uniref:Equilibrative nucleoside transporter n=2 Tax=Aphanomyces astaci TaxID=112090 RepID=W4H571_APHAT|nr:hypothetical protein H257_02707 [Aphanomyces astaci]ETV86288.1 hypothetical protein H257_02707 [Aphanomyces astaci]RQM29905.1 hypothetical protein B5M09_004982 [Aphanomyces astaci]|eukprot:XP_009824760.1 hypothetical protein H257_02707 [Aphanomyces astaci]